MNAAIPTHPTPLSVRGIPTERAQSLWRGGPDAHGQPPLRRIARGLANPCRHCLQLIPDGQPMLVLAWRPFDSLQPYAEAGPVFLHAEPCTRWDAAAFPPWFVHLTPALVRGYDEDDWIRYDTGQVVQGPELAAACARILADPGVAYVHVRSKFNCYQCRVDRG